MGVSVMMLERPTILGMDTLCATPGCTNPREIGRTYRRTVCSPCHSRKKRNGDATLVKSRVGRSWVGSHGYMMRTDHSHPLSAPSNGALLVHREVLYAKLGPGTHECHWCTAPVDWALTHPTPGALVVDHIDHNKSNNDPANLVPSCVACNSSRGNLHRYHPEV